MSVPDPPSRPSLPEAPGAKASRRLGVLSILLALTVLGIPAALALALAALLQAGKAARAARNQPGAFSAPGGTGTLLGILGLASCLGMLFVALLAVPLGLGLLAPRRMNRELQEQLRSLEGMRAENERVIEELMARQKALEGKDVAPGQVPPGPGKTGSDGDGEPPPAAGGNPR